MNTKERLLQAIKTEENLHRQMVGDLELLSQRVIELGGDKVARTISNSLITDYSHNIYQRYTEPVFAEEFHRLLLAEFMEDLYHLENK